MGGPLKVHHLRPAAGAHTKKTRVGRGDGSKGKTAGRGTKGTQGPLPGSGRLRGRPDADPHAAAQAQGLQEPLPGRVSRSSTSPRWPSCSREGGTVGVDELVAAGAVRKGEPVKVLGNGDLGAVKLDVTANAFSGTAREKIDAAGGTVTEL